MYVCMYGGIGNLLLAILYVENNANDLGLLM